MKYNLEDFIIMNRNFPDYTVFSMAINTLYFEFASPYLLNKISLGKCIFACKEHYEELVSQDIQLQLEYVNVYDNENEFYYVQNRDETEAYDFYILTRNGNILMFFTRVSP